MLRLRLQSQLRKSPPQQPRQLTFLELLQMVELELQKVDAPTFYSVVHLAKSYPVGL